MANQWARGFSLAAVAAPAQLIGMRYFGALAAEKTAEALGHSVHIVRHDLRLAQAWRRQKLNDENIALTRGCSEPSLQDLPALPNCNGPVWHHARKALLQSGWPPNLQVYSLGGPESKVQPRVVR